MTLVLAGGGTAGHVNPLLATAHELAGRGHRILVVGTATGMEKDLVPASGFDFATVERAPFPRRPDRDALRFPVAFPRSVRQARRILTGVGATLAVGFGGFASTPVYAAARRAGIPVVVHEQNALPGLANKLGARGAAAVGLTFPSTPLRAARGITRTVGLPLRPAIAALASADRAEARTVAAARLGLDPHLPTLVVTGGSLGAAHLNDVMTAAAPRCAAAGVQLLHLTGRGKAAEAQRAAATIPSYHVLEYLEEMELAYAVADTVVCRAGAGTVAEVSALGIPAVFVPLPIGNGEQARNAADVVAAGGALLIPNAQFTADSVGTVLDIVTDTSARTRMAQASRAICPADGAARLADLIEEVLR
ncbi:undecaprenyldiphospho-muramoylpentapeptide beta-N-acetylglucosaminyltransferase [Actinotignum sanguinis]|uniref:UDP-N-acetylglucosamine--N-acetylmuramyl-(pentapeptide) pyrophosphoryl-undecaprenol N-acetylglucosamine transferase n=4 Tax=Actinomycetaceae TaxID=2049 RepID=A0ABZ0REH8_9ACTO|nr:undecaprenyldiphospho-muramoylpentapeptide beta-N-acetylglucosaminyltransferase [Actinotignum sanguinis]WPJ89435.1 undecaprenyldiphospho-muramoylpentapeptide beta-N-acetylglucosaminyltransferase [Schaalia turicensis]MDE1552608.1 undecaprenyldiphospho-muramoylpentapeptide beta-N-acetylglucosaminyltransferase [Actinotignum sanguinis]MDE1565345.1 undecaprenyldiphospho-muramoylpentapeptide beta-N-acetylglucosaminyltransferase [Actinotignum sanguinis]MDE1577189.1 undecaprenyldiphospho-muramoylpen